MNTSKFLLLIALVAVFVLIPYGRVNAEPEPPTPTDTTIQPNSSAAPATVVHNDDVLIDGNLCVGDQCSDPETHGNDVIRLKSHYIRLHFEDTTTIGSGGNDWRILINDTNVGGDQYFAIEDSSASEVPLRIDAGADDDALRITSSGKVGLGTASPQNELHIVGPTEPTIRLDQSGGLSTAQNWLIGGNESVFVIVDETHSSKKPFAIRTDAPSNALTIFSSGNVGVGTTLAKAPLHVQRSDGTARLQVEESSTTAAERTLGLFSNKGALNLQLDNTDVDRQWLVGVRSGGDFRIQSNQAAAGVINFLMNLDGALTISGNLTVGSCSGCSAARGADDRVVSADVLARLSELPIRRWRTRDAVEHLLPDMDAFHRLTGLGGADGIAPLDVATLSLAGVQALQAENDALRQELAQLKKSHAAELADIHARLTALEANSSGGEPASPRSGAKIYLPSTRR